MRPGQPHKSFHDHHVPAAMDFSTIMTIMSWHSPVMALQSAAFSACISSRGRGGQWDSVLMKAGQVLHFLWQLRKWVGWARPLISSMLLMFSLRLLLFHHFSSSMQIHLHWWRVQSLCYNQQTQWCGGFWIWPDRRAEVTQYDRTSQLCRQHFSLCYHLKCDGLVSHTGIQW